MSQISGAVAAEYTVNGFVLDKPIPAASTTYRSYSCQDSDLFDGYRWCQRSQHVSAIAGAVQGATLNSEIFHGPDRTATYLTTKVAPVTISKTEIDNEISDLAKGFNEQPKHIDWISEQDSGKTGVVATWGNVVLSRATISDDDLQNIQQVSDIGDGFFIDHFGDPVESAKAHRPVYRIEGGAGYIYAASVGSDGRGHRRYVAADIARPVLKKFEPELTGIFKQDQSRRADDYESWPDVARVARNIALAASPETANVALDAMSDRFKSNKFRTHVWSLLPLGTIDSLGANIHWQASTYGQQTDHADVRDAIRQFLSDHPSEPFSDLLYYTIREYNKALDVNPNSIIKAPIRFAIGHRMLGELLQSVAKTIKSPVPNIDGTGDDNVIDSTMVSLNQNPGLYGDKLLGEIVPDFASRATAIKPWLQAVVNDKTSPQQDDAAYILGWLAFHQGQTQEALTYMDQAMTLANYDYGRPAAVRQIIRIMGRSSAADQAKLVASNSVFAQQSTLWYVAARSAYRNFDYDLTVKIGEQGLKALKIAYDRLPKTTDPEAIEDALKKNLPKTNADPDNFYDPDLVEIPYIVEAAKELLQYAAFLNTLESVPPDVVSKRAKAIVVKYSLMLDQPTTAKPKAGSPVPEHKDLRQAIHLIDMTLDHAPKTSQLAELREWLYYRKIRILTQFDPARVASAVTAMATEYPQSKLLNDAFAEQIYAEGAQLKEVDAAEKTFKKLLETFPKGNAVDNAYTWMGIIYRCAGQLDKAQKINKDIIKLFPLTRHAVYAAERMASPKGCGLSSWDQADGQP